MNSTKRAWLQRRLACTAGTLAVLLCGLAGKAAHAFGDNWPNWRGPSQNSIVEEADYPTTWSDSENIEWKVEVPGWGTSTPAVWGDKIFLTFCDDESNGMICFDLNGSVLWQAKLGKTAGNRNQKASGANPSAVADENHVFGYFRSGEVACLDHDGNVKWSKNTQEEFGADKLWWDLGTSPVLTDNAVVITVMHQGPSYLVALQKQDGEILWKTDRNVEAPREAKDSYTTPQIIKTNGKNLLVTLGADHVTAHNAENGELVWQVGGLNPRQQGNFRSIASATFEGDHLYAPYSRGRALTAIRLGGTGDVTESHVSWRIDNTSSDVPSPIAYRGRIYLCSDRGEVSCLNAESGEEIWKQRLERNRFPYSASPVIAGGNLYVTREDGATSVLSIGDDPKVVATNELDEFTYASPVFVNGKIIQRTSGYLVCIAN